VFPVLPEQSRSYLDGNTAALGDTVLELVPYLVSPSSALIGSLNSPSIYSCLHSSFFWEFFWHFLLVYSAICFNSFCLLSTLYQLIRKRGQRSAGCKLNTRAMEWGKAWGMKDVTRDSKENVGLKFLKTEILFKLHSCHITHWSYESCVISWNLLLSYFWLLYPNHRECETSTFNDECRKSYFMNIHKIITSPPKDASLFYYFFNSFLKKLNLYRNSITFLGLKWVWDRTHS